MLLRHQLFAHLRDLFANLYIDVASSRTIVADAGLAERRIKFSDRAADNWREILDEAERQQRMSVLLAVARRDFPEHQPLRQAEQVYQQWRRRGRLSWRRLVAAASFLLTGTLLALKLPPFHDRPVWYEIGRVPVTDTRQLARVEDVLLLTTSTESEDCDAVDSGIWRSTDRGATWQPIAGEPLLNNRNANRCRRAYVTDLVHMTTPTHTVIYAATAMLDDSDENTVGLLRSDDQGLTWTRFGQNSFRSENLGYVSFIDQEPTRLVVATVGAEQAFAALYRSSTGGIEWEKISGISPCPIGFANSLPVARRLFALVSTQDALYTGIGSGLYMSSDQGDCWQKLEQDGTDYSYTALTTFSEPANQLLVATYDRTILWRNSHDVRLFDLRANRLEKSLSAIAESIDVVYVHEPSKHWFVANNSGMIARGSYTQTQAIEFLPTVTRCNNFLIGCPIALAPDVTGEVPLVLAQGRVYRYQTQGPWWRAVWP